MFEALIPRPRTQARVLDRGVPVVQGKYVTCPILVGHFVSGIGRRLAPGYTCSRDDTNRVIRVHVDWGGLPPQHRGKWGEYKPAIVVAAAAIGRTRTRCAQSGSVCTARGGSRLEACLCSNEGRSTNLSCRGWNASLHAAAEKECTPREQHHARGHGKDVGRCNTCCGLFDPRCRHLLI